MEVRFWGVRGSIASAITSKEVEAKLRRALELATPADLLTPESIDNFISSLPFSIRGTYGGNTTCVEILSSGGEKKQICIIDAGTGIRPLGNSLLERGRMQGNDELYLFFTHSHWDHIQGLMFFAPIYIPGNTLHIYSSFADIESRLRYQQVRTHFPVIMEEMAAKKLFYHIPEMTPQQIGYFTVKTKAVRHPGGCYSFRFEENGKSFVFCSDAEFNLDTIDEIGSYLEFFAGADVLVFDTQYTFEESLRKIDWGHSSAAIATDIALRSGVKKLVMFHHDPSYSDSKMDELIIQTLKYKDMAGFDQNLEIIVAYEGLSLEI